MKIKKYEVSDMKEALRMIKEDLGSDAVILSTRKVMKSNNFGLFARPVLEVTAAVEYDIPPEKQSSKKAAAKPNGANGALYAGGYPSAYAAAAKPKIVKEVPASVPKKTISAGGYNPYNKAAYGYGEGLGEADDYLAEAMAEAGIDESDNDMSFFPPQRQVDIADDAPVPAYIPKPRVQKRAAAKEREYTEIPQEPQKSQAELNAEKMAAIIKAVGLDKFSDLLSDIGDIKKQLSNMQSNIADNIVIDLSQKLKGYHALLTKNGVDDIISYRLLKSLESQAESGGITNAQIKSAVADSLAALVPVEKNYAHVMTSKIVALAGPTGVGKTTTIAKIAASMALKYGKSVCLITVDNFRIGAVEQLKTYAEIVNLPLYVATSPEELARVIADARGRYDCVLIDSMGRSQFDTGQIEGIKEFLKTDAAITTSLVLSMASNHGELYDTFDRYEILKPDYLIFTKLDETKYFGPLINIPVKKKLPLLLVTTGQNVPDDMETPDGKKIARRVLQEIPAQWSDT